MELKEFIKAAVSDVTGAIRELQDTLDNGAVVNPTLPHAIANTTLVIDNEVRAIERMDFDVAVTASESSGVDGSAKAGISIFGAKVGTESSARLENASRLTFSIPVVFPAVHVKTQQEILREKRPKRLPTD